MSFLKFWGKKDKKDGDDGRNDEPVLADPEAEKRRLRHSLSISRSGRFKQKKRERGQILDKPEIFDDSHSHSEKVTMTSHAQSSTGQFGTGNPTHKSSHKSSPQSTCRDVNKSMARGRLRMGQSVVT